VSKVRISMVVGLLASPWAEKERVLTVP